MTVVGFTGPAGTGKTWSVMQALKAELASAPLLDGQRVLGLTFMHGSRRRLDERLASLVRGRFDCRTFDSFAWEVVSRWRTRNEAQRAAPPEGLTPFDVTCLEASRLLAAEDVATWVTRRFPVIVVDEFQDCSAERLGIVQALAPHARLIIAADEFQDLKGVGANAAVDWLATQQGVRQLTEVRRTNRAGLLNAALALRNGTGVEAGDGFSLASVPSTSVAASKITYLIAGKPRTEFAVLSPTRPGSSPFVDEVVTFVATKPYGKKNKVGPYALRWEEAPDAVQSEAMSALGIKGVGDSTLLTLAQVLAVEGALSRPLAHWCEHQRRINGRDTFSGEEVRVAIQRLSQQQRAHQSATSGRRATTIHQAKNREFDHVVVLWPYKVTGDPLMARRQLYNALTRARLSALVLVQDPRHERIKAAPFV